MALGQIGFFPGVTEVVATAVNSGILLGGFFLGGMIAVFLVLIDLALRYAG